MLIRYQQQQNLGKNMALVKYIIVAVAYIAVRGGGSVLLLIRCLMLLPCRVLCLFKVLLCSALCSF